MTLATDDDVVTLPDEAAELADDQAEGDLPAESEGGEVDEAGEVVVSIGGEAPPEDEDDEAATDGLSADQLAGVIRLRQTKKLLKHQLREKDAELARLRAAPAAAAPVVAAGARPTLAEFEYDEDKHAEALDAWHERKRQADEAQRKQADATKAAQDAWAGKLADYGKAKTSLKVADFDDAEDLARETFSVMQQGVILNGADNAALMVYALGKNPKKARELAAIADPVRFAFAVAKLETQLKVTPRKTAPIPERTIRGSAPGAVAGNSTLEKLRAEADKTGDRTKVVRYMNEQKAAARK